MKGYKNILIGLFLFYIFVAYMIYLNKVHKENISKINLDKPKDVLTLHDEYGKEYYAVPIGGIKYEIYER